LKENKRKGSIVEEFLKNNKGLKILTDTGWSAFAGLSIKPKKELVSISTKTTHLKCTPDHNIFGIDCLPIPAKDYVVSEWMQTEFGIDQIKSMEKSPAEIVFDIVEVEKNNRFYANGILVANCKFISFDETLINPFVLNTLSGVEPVETQGSVRWYVKPTKGNIYIVSLDPSIGTGGDPSAIQVFEANTNKQVAEWCHNKTTIENQVKLLKEITTYLVGITEQSTDVYWSVENNTIGEATLVTIRAIGEENIPGVFLSETVKPGQTRKFRKGFTTTNTSKLTACAKLKSLIENKKMKIYSRKLVSELKVFVSVENTYRAKPGETDDLVTALITTVRMMETLKGYIPSLADIRETSDEDSMPLPFLMSCSPSKMY